MSAQDDPVDGGLGEAGTPNEDLDAKQRRLADEHASLQERAKGGADVSADLAQLATDEADAVVERLKRDAESSDPGKR